MSKSTLYTTTTVVYTREFPKSVLEDISENWERDRKGPKWRNERKCINWFDDMIHSALRILASHLRSVSICRVARKDSSLICDGANVEDIRFTVRVISN
ncbi:hypothetical protein EAE96_000110 [Botrytis aclada]|nr:hypothetical protein EAE96_000110 [Botrytis aclada]